MEATPTVAEVDSVDELIEERLDHAHADVGVLVHVLLQVVLSILED